MPNHWETHLYTHAVALTQGDKIRPENLAGTRAKAIKEQGLGIVLLLELDPQHYITTGKTTSPSARREATSATAPHDPEAELRALWTAQGVTQERQEEVLRQITAMAQPGASVGPFRIGQPYRTQLTPAGEQYMIPGTEPEDRPKTAQLSLF